MILIKKDAIIRTNFKAFNGADVINKAQLDEHLLEINGHLSFLKNIIDLN